MKTYLVFTCLEHPDNITDYSAMENPSQILHPDCSTGRRYIMGTKFQSRNKSGKKAHKLASCSFHNLDLSIQGSNLKTMSQGKNLHETNFLSIFVQESLQNVRKHRMIQQDKLRSFECSFLANYIGDFNHNKRRYEENMKTIKREFSCVERDSLLRMKQSSFKK